MLVVLVWRTLRAAMPTTLMRTQAGASLAILGALPATASLAAMAANGTASAILAAAELAPMRANTSHMSAFLAVTANLPMTTKQECLHTRHAAAFGQAMQADRDAAATFRTPW